MNTANQAILYDAFNSSYEKAVAAKDNGEFGKAKKLFLLAGEYLLKLAQTSDGEFKRARLDRADRLINIANSLPDDASPAAASELEKPSGKRDRVSAPTFEDTETKFRVAAIPDTKFDDVAGLDDVKRAVFTRIIKPRNHPEVYKALNKKPGGGILMYGPPGTGKTMIAEAIAHEVKAAFFSVKCSEIVSKWFGEAEKNIKNLFEAARENETSIIFFDEFESLAAKRGGNSTVMNRLVPELLSQINGFQNSYNTLMLIAATNRPWDIDSAFLRPGRFAELLYIPLPDQKARRHILSKAYAGVPMEADIDLDELADHMHGFNGADVVEFCDRSTDPAADRCIEEHDGDISYLLVTKEDIDLTLKRVKSSVQEQDITNLEKFMKQYAKRI